MQPGSRHICCLDEHGVTPRGLHQWSSLCSDAVEKTFSVVDLTGTLIKHSNGACYAYPAHTVLFGIV
jgi:hypothetical protein